MACKVWLYKYSKQTSFQLIIILRSKTTIGCLVTQNYFILAHWYKQTYFREIWEVILYHRKNTLPRGFAKLIWFNFLNSCLTMKYWDIVECLLEIFRGRQYSKMVRRVRRTLETHCLGSSPHPNCDLQQLVT